MKICAILILCAAVSTIGAELSPVHLADPMQGTDSHRGYSHGNEYPAIALPFPMNTWAPYTEPASDPFYYQYPHQKIRGIRQTHQPSPWIGDYAAFSLMPVCGRLAVNENDRASAFRHEEERAQPNYYRVRLDTWKAIAEVTPTERCARFRFTFEGDGDAFVVLDAFPGNSMVEIIPAQNKIIGISRFNHGGVSANFANYFVVVFDRPFAAFGTWTPDGTQPDKIRLEAKHAGAFVRFEVSSHPTVLPPKARELGLKSDGKKSSRMIECKVASSFISPEQAMRNLEKEIGGADFDTVRRRGEQVWHDAFGRARVEGGSDDQRRTFYSAFYRSVVYPHRLHEYNQQGKPVYFSPYDDRVHEGVFYTDTGFWDTFRAAHPFYNLLFPEISAEILQSLLNSYEQSGWLPSWSSPGHRNCMIGNHAFSLFADGWVKGIRSFDALKAVSAMAHDANAQGPDNCRSIGRDGADFYNKLGYVPYSPVKGEPSIHEATAKTLEFAYDDFCAARLAQAVGRPAEAAQFLVKAMNYTNVFDAKTGFVRGRKADGAWCEPFDPTEWGGPFTEGSSWHWTWSVFHDVPGLISLMGGEKAFAAKLDSVFTSPNTFKVGTYGGVIHEMTEMVALDLGQYAHGNEPIHHMIYLYNSVGQPWKTQARVRMVMNKLYQAAPDGLCGDEDTGQMSAWYVFGALGFYPVCPGDTAYEIGSPLFKRATLSLGKGKTFVVSAGNNGPQRPYIRGATLNGQPFNRTFLSHEEIVNGGEVVFDMTSAPNYEWATAPEARTSSPTRRLADGITAAAK